MCPFFHLFSLFGVVVSQPSTSTVGPDIPGIILLYDVPGIIYLACVYTYIVLLRPLLMLWTGVGDVAAAAVRRRVPSGKNCC